MANLCQAIALGGYKYGKNKTSCIMHSNGLLGEVFIWYFRMDISTVIANKFKEGMHMAGPVSNAIIYSQ